MKKEQLGQLIIASEDTMYHVAKTLLYSDADCADAIQEAIVKAFSNLHTYLPQGMVETEEGKYSYEESLSKGGVTIILYRMDTGDDGFKMQDYMVIR